MTTRYFTDWLLGINPTYGSRVTAAQFGFVLGGIRAIDAAIEGAVCQNWRLIKHNSGYSNNTLKAACYDSTARNWIFCSQDTTDPANPGCMYGPDPAAMASGSVTAGDGLTIWDVTTDGVGSNVMVGGTGSSTDKLIRYSTDGGATWAVSNTTVATDAYLKCVCYALHASMKWCAGSDDGYIYSTSAANTNWTQRSTPWTAGGTAIKSLATDGSILVAISSDSTNQCLTSTDGITWTQQTMAATMYGADIVYVPSQAQFVAVGTASGTTFTVQTSPDGTNWSAATPTLVTGYSNPYIETVRSTGNHLVGISNLQGRVFMSRDLGTTWKRIATLHTSTADTAGTSLPPWHGLAVATDDAGIAAALVCHGDVTGGSTARYYHGSLFAL